MIDPLRHLQAFDPQQWGQRRVDVIGVGATGSRVALHLAELGVTNLHVWDDDCVERHNLANQAYGIQHIGMPKVEAIQQVIQDKAGETIHIHNQKVDGSQVLGEVVFLLTDSMDSRIQIWAEGIKGKLRIKLLVETRMGLNEGRIYAFAPANPSHAEAWEKTLYLKEEASPSECRASQSIADTAAVVAGIAVSRFRYWFALQKGSEESELVNETIFGIHSGNMFPRSF